MMRDRVKAVLLDLDGTVHYGDALIPGARETVDYCRARGKQVFFLTNNSARTRSQVLERLRGMGLACELDEVITSGYVSSLFVLQQGLSNVFVCGTDDLRSELEACGVDLCSAERAENLVIGYDPDFNYEKLALAVRIAIRAEAVIACNMERVFRGANAEVFPGCGGMVAPIEWCAGRKVDYVAGKPNILPLEILCRAHGFAHDEIVMVGDTYESDIVMADRYGCPSVLVGDDERCDAKISIANIGDLIDVIG